MAAWRQTVDESVGKWQKALAKPQDEQSLIAALTNHVRQALAAVPAAELETAITECVKSHRDRVLSANAALVQHAVTTHCEGKVKEYTTRSMKTELTRESPSPVFSTIQHFVEVLTVDAEKIVNSYLTPESRKAVNVTRTVEHFEELLFLEYKRWEIDVITYVEQDFQSNLSVDFPAVECTIMDLDCLLYYYYKDHWKKCKESLANIAPTLPRTLKRKYKSQVKDLYVKWGLDQIAQQHIKNYKETLLNQLRAVMACIDGYVLFDEREVRREDLEVVYIRVFHAVEKYELEASEFLAELARYMGIAEVRLSAEEFQSAWSRFQAHTNTRSAGFVLACILLILTRTFQQYGQQSADNPTSTIRYTALRRLMFRDIVTCLYQQQNSPRLFRVDEWTLGKPCELVLAEYLSELNHPLVSTQPDKVLEMWDRCGSQAALDREETLTGDEPQAQSWFQTMKSTFYEKPANETFQWKVVKSVTSVNTTILVSGWLSEDSDYLTDWSHVHNYFLESNTLTLNWSAGTPWGVTAQFLLWLPLTIRSFASGSEFSWNAFLLACRKAEHAGKLLADNIERRAFGLGPVTLIGFSLGTRVIFSCLERLKEITTEKYVENVILLGGAMENSPSRWSEVVKATVAGEVCNVYSANDWTLRYLYQVATRETPIGLGPIDCKEVQNFDAESVVLGHLDHRTNMNSILELIHYRP